MKVLFLSAALLSFTACRHPGEHQPATSSNAPLYSGLDATLWTQTAAEHAALCQSIYQAAEPHIARNIADRAFDALAVDQRHTGDAQEEPAVIFDLDETLLDNSPFQAELLLRGIDYNDPTWNEWVAKASAGALPGASNLLSFIRSKNAHVIYITNRGSTTNAAEKEAARQFTLRDLRSVGFPIESETDSLLLPGDPERQATKSGDKTSRREFVSRKYRVVALFGDDLGDFVSVEGKDLPARMKIVAGNQDRWGTCWFPLANSMYGSWLRTLTKDLKGTPREKQDQKLKLLKGFNR